MKWIVDHRKAIIALLGAAATFATAVGLDQYPWVAAVIGVLSAAGVYQVRNGPKPEPVHARPKP